MKFPSPEPTFILHPSAFILTFPGRGVTLASEFWKLVVTVQFCPPGPGKFQILDFRFQIEWMSDEL
jgi:hypothetical protein